MRNLNCIFEAEIEIDPVLKTLALFPACLENLAIQKSSGQFQASWSSTNCECAADEFEVRYTTVDYCGIETSVTLQPDVSTTITIDGSFESANVEVKPLKIYNGIWSRGKWQSTSITDITSGKFYTCGNFCAIFSRLKAKICCTSRVNARNKIINFIKLISSETHECRKSAKD